MTPASYNQMPSQEPTNQQWAINEKQPGGLEGT